MIRDNRARVQVLLECVCYKNNRQKKRSVGPKSTLYHVHSPCPHVPHNKRNHMPFIIDHHHLPLCAHGRLYMCRLVLCAITLVHHEVLQQRHLKRRGAGELDDAKRGRPLALDRAQVTALALKLTSCDRDRLTDLRKGRLGRLSGLLRRRRLLGGRGGFWALAQLSAWAPPSVWAQPSVWGRA